MFTLRYLDEDVTIKDVNLAAKYGKDISQRYWKNIKKINDKKLL